VTSEYAQTHDWDDEVVAKEKERIYEITRKKAVKTIRL